MKDFNLKNIDQELFILMIFLKGEETASEQSNQNERTYFNQITLSLTVRPQEKERNRFFK